MAKNDKKKRKNKHKKTKGTDVIDSVEKDILQEENKNVTDALEPQSNKRTFTEDNSDNEDQPKKKKKKKQPAPSGDSKGNKSIRQMKREKHAQRTAEKAAVAKDQLKAQCISYLSQWKHDRNNWKFMKVKQVWLYKNKFSSYLLPDSSWPVFLEYFESAKGNIRNMLLDDANKIIKEMDEWTESQNKSKTGEGDDQDEKDDGPKKPDDTAYKRARDLIQCLQE